MLKRASENNLREIKALCQNNILGTRILCYITAYGFERNFLEVWIIEKDNDVTGVLTKYYDDVTLLTTENAETEQLSAFLNMLNFNTLTCHADICDVLGYENPINRNGYRFDGEVFEENADILTEEDFLNAYTLISAEIPGSFSNDREAYLSFLSDFTFRERRGLARGVCTHTSGGLSSVALTSSETADSAIISGVACDRTLQNRGLGKKTVLALVNMLSKENKKAYVIALNESAEGFYEHIGFKMTEKIAFVERK